MAANDSRKLIFAILVSALEVTFGAFNTSSFNALGQSNNNSTNGAVESGPTITSLYFLTDGTGWLSLDSYPSRIIPFNHTLTAANGYTIYFRSPYFSSNGTKVDFHSIDFSSQIIIDSNENVTLPAYPKISPYVGLDVPSALPPPSSSPLAPSTTTQQQSSPPSQATDPILLSKNYDDRAFIVITAGAGQCWSGSIMGSDGVQTTWDGCGNGYHAVPCSGFFGIYSLAMQLMDESFGTSFLVQVWKGGELLKQGSTSADYGVVSFAGGCG